MKIKCNLKKKIAQAFEIVRAINPVVELQMKTTPGIRFKSPYSWSWNHSNFKKKRKRKKKIKKICNKRLYE